MENMIQGYYAGYQYLTLENDFYELNYNTGVMNVYSKKSELCNDFNRAKYHRDHAKNENATPRIWIQDIFTRSIRIFP
jgi:hypothetical protein